MSTDAGPVAESGGRSGAVARLQRSTTVRYLVVGVLNTLIDLGLFLLLQPAIGVVLANLASTGAGMSFSFVVNGRFTFRSRLTVRQAVRFVVLVGGVLWVVQPVVIHLLIAVGFAVPVAKLGGIAVVVVSNYLVYRFLIWPEPSTGDRSES